MLAICRTLWPYVAVMVGFVAFVAWNGGIVVGDRTNHTAGLHLPQLGYFVLFATAFSAPVTIATLADALISWRRCPRSGVHQASVNKGQALGALGGAFVGLTLVYVACIAWFTVQHKYLLSGVRLSGTYRLHG
jgi:alpha-1,2-glucosyltransferase